MAEHPNVERARNGFRAFADGDAATILELLREDVVWRIGGSNLLAGTYEGRGEALGVLARSLELTEDNYRATFEWAVGDDEHVVAVYRATGRRPDGREIDIRQALVVRVEAGRWVEVEAVPFDQHAFDAFWA